MVEETLKPLSVNEYTITDAISFSEEIRNLPINEDSILVSYDVTALEQIDGVAMGSPLGPLMANVFLCHLEEKLRDLSAGTGAQIT